MIITHKLEIDMADRSTLQRIDVVQGDANSRVLELTLLSGGEAWNVPENAVARMRYCKSDGTKGIYDTLPDGTTAWKAEGNIVTVVLAPQMLTAAGMVLAQLELIQGTATLATFTIQIGVERNPAAGALESEDYINWLQWMEGQLDRYLLQAKESGDFDGPQGIQGEPGPDVFDYAVEAGYSGTEAEFAQMLITPGLPLVGGTMLGAVNMNGQALSGLISPSKDTDAATKAYVDQRRRTATATLRAAGWSSTAPYTHNVSISGIQAGDWVRITPLYKNILEADLEIKAAFACVSYAYSMTKYFTVVCLENKPTIDFNIFVEVLK